MIGVVLNSACATRVGLLPLAVPYLSLLMAGTKTIGSRFSRNYVAPFGLLNSGDIMLLKRTGADVVGIARAGQVKFLERSDPS